MRRDIEGCSHTITRSIDYSILVEKCLLPLNLPYRYLELREDGNTLYHSIAMIKIIMCKG